jgi:hypothetical protein
LSQQSKAKWRSTAVANFTPKELEEPSAAHWEVSQMSMKSVFLAVGGRIPQLPGGENAIAFEDTRDGEQKKDLVEGAVTGRPRCQCMSHQDTHDLLSPMDHHPLSRWTDPHPNLFDETSLLHICHMQDHCFLLAGWRADIRLATLCHLHTSLFASDVLYCKVGENEFLVVQDFLKVTVTYMYEL